MRGSGPHGLAGLIEREFGGFTAPPDCDMRGLIRGSAGLDQPVKDDRDDDDTAANANQAGE
jgi:hypothetical protein